MKIMLFKINKKSNESGLAALLVIVIVAAAILLMSFSALLLGLGELDLGYTSQKGGEAFFVADGCLEETLGRIRSEPSYGIGEEINLSVSNGLCIINVIDIGGDQRRITVLGKSGDYNKKIEAEISLSGNVITIDSWKEKEN